MEQRKDRPKVVVSERFAFERDAYCWHLHETREGRNRKTGEVTTYTKTTYHPNLTQVAETIIDRSAGSGDSIQTIIESIENARDAVIEAIEGMQWSR